MSPPVTAISVDLPELTSTGVVYESGDSERASVGLSTRQIVLPVLPSTLITYDGSSVFIPCSTWM
jgi:hypothetical protein